MKICEFCKSEHDGSYGTGRFCSPTCARKYSNTFVSESGRQNQIDALNNNREKAISNNNHNRNNKVRHKKQYRNDLRPTFKHPLALGKVGELDVYKKFIEHGYNVYVPLIDAGDGIDFIFNDGNEFKTVQVKSSTDSKINNDGVCETTSFKVCQNVRHIHEGSYSQTSSKYSPDKINYIALYSACDDDSYLFENTDELPINMTIRHIYNNGQKKKIRYAENYQIDNVLDNFDLIPGVYYDENIIDCDFKEIN